MPRKPDRVTLKSAKQLMLAAVAEQLGGKTPAVAKALGTTPDAIASAKQNHKAFLLGCRSAARKLTSDLKKKGLLTDQVLARKNWGYSTLEILRIFLAVVGLVAKEAIGETEAAIRFGFGYATYFRLKNEHQKLHDEACEQFGLHCPPDVAPVPAKPSVRAFMKQAATYANMQYSDGYVADILGRNRALLGQLVARFDRYWQWLRDQSLKLPEAHMARIWVCDTKSGATIAHSRAGTVRAIARSRKVRPYLESLGLPAKATDAEIQTFLNKLDDDSRARAEAIGTAEKERTALAKKRPPKKVHRTQRCAGSVVLLQGPGQPVLISFCCGKPNGLFCR